MKVSLFDKQLWKNYLKWVSGSSVIISLVLAFVDFCQGTKWVIGGIYIGGLVVLLIVLWILANKKDHITLRINNSTVNVFFGDIFKQNGYKVIGFNEYFDTEVNGNLISSTTLNGQYIQKIAKNVSDLDAVIESDTHIPESVVGINEKRKQGKKWKYRLGTICPNNDYFLLAFSHFDENNCASLTLQQYTACLMKMWSEIDILYGGNTVSIPLLGSGITRFRDHIEMTDQELLEIIIWTLKISKVKFTYPSTMNIVLPVGKRDKINIYKLKEEE